jgi:hypothetical protein
LMLSTVTLAFRLTVGLSSVIRKYARASHAMRGDVASGWFRKAISAAYRREGDFGCGVVGHTYRAAAAIC